MKYALIGWRWSTPTARVGIVHVTTIAFKVVQILAGRNDAKERGEVGGGKFIRKSIVSV